MQHRNLTLIINCIDVLVNCSLDYVRFAVDETFLRADTMERLTAIEKMIQIGLITVEQAREMEDLSPNGDTSEIEL